MNPPPSRAEWAIEGELRGHTVPETLAWASRTAEYEDEQTRRRRVVSATVISSDIAPGERVLGFLRRLRGRE